MLSMSHMLANLRAVLLPTLHETKSSALRGMLSWHIAIPSKCFAGIGDSRSSLVEEESDLSNLIKVGCRHCTTIRIIMQSRHAARERRKLASARHPRRKRGVLCSFKIRLCRDCVTSGSHIVGFVERRDAATIAL